MILLYTRHNFILTPVNYAEGLKLRAVELLKVNSGHYVPMKIRKGIIWKEEIIDGHKYIDVKSNFILGLNVNEIMDKTLLKVCSFLSSIISSINNFFSDLKYDLTFYSAAITLVKFYKKYNLAYCRAELLKENENRTEGRGLYDLSLAAQFAGKGKHDKIREIVPNDFSTDDGRIMVVTGANQGGKTTFLRSAGIAQLFMQVGVHVPARIYKSSPASYIASHFPKDEENNFLSGRLEEELKRLHEIFLSAKRNCFILFNEPFASTTVMEGVQIARDVIKALSYINSRVIFVTHLYEFAASLDELNRELYNDEKAVSLVAEVVVEASKSTVGGAAEQTSDRTETRKTYRIIRGEPQKRLYIDDIIKGRL